MSTAEHRQPRRTQEERTATMRQRLLDATLASLDEVGYAATTTRRVAELAGVSQGAQSHHFPRRVDLVGAALEYATEQRTAALAAVAPDLPETPKERAAAVLDIMWKDFSSQLFTVFVKLWVAAADDPELYERLVPLERRLGREIAQGMRVLSPTSNPSLQDSVCVTVALAALRGLALSHAFEPSDRGPRDLWADVRPTLVTLLASA